MAHSGQDWPFSTSTHPQFGVPAHRYAHRAEARTDGWVARTIVREDLPMLSDHPVFPILLSTDLDASRTFYRDTLGLEVFREDPDRIVFRCGGGFSLSQHELVSRADTSASGPSTAGVLRLAIIGLALDASSHRHLVG